MNSLMIMASKKDGVGSESNCTHSFKPRKVCYTALSTSTDTQMHTHTQVHTHTHTHTSIHMRALQTVQNMLVCYHASNCMKRAIHTLQIRKLNKTQQTRESYCIRNCIEYCMYL